MARALAINVGANTNNPGFRGPIYPDGTFEFVPIPESEPTRESVPTYADLDLRTDVSSVADVPVHLDPEFADYPRCQGDTYGDPHGAKAGPISDLEPGDWLVFYATLSTAGSDADEGTGDDGNDADDDGDDGADDEHAAWIAPDWGAYLIGEFRIDRVVAPDPDDLGGDPADALSPADRERFASNAHCAREAFDARVLVAGDPAESGFYDRAVPLSSPDSGVEANRLVTVLSADSGKGPWWRRPLRFDVAATGTLRDVVEGRAFDPWL